MACVGCEGYEKRITNIFRDDDLKDRFEKIIGNLITVDCFICDKCNGKLLEASEFQENCIRIYKKSNLTCSNNKKEENVNLIEKQDNYIILETIEEQLEGAVSQNDDPLNDNYDIIEIVEECKEIQLPSIQKQEDEKSSRISSRLRKHKVEECVIIEKDSEIDESIMHEDFMIQLPEAQSTPNNKNDTMNGTKGTRKQRRSYTAQQKLEIIDYSEDHTNREAARKFNLNESTVRCFRRQKEALLKMDPNRSTNRHGTPYWPDLELKLKEWADNQTFKPKMSDIKKEAKNIASKMSYGNFSGSNTYIFKLMQRNNIQSASPRPRKKRFKFEDSSDSDSD